MNKILVIDDDESINQLVQINLELAGYKVFCANDGISGFAMAKQETPDLIILDVMMPDVDGYTVAKRIRENNEIKETPIIMLTALGMLDNKVKGFDIGVDDYLVKPFEIEELKVRVRALLKRTDKIPKSAATREILQQGDITLLPETYSVKIKDKTAKVTPIEFDIINLLMQNYDNIVSGAKILKEIWGYNPDDDVETIRVHIRHIRAKLDKISGDKQYIETVYGGGYKLVPNGILKKSKSKNTK